MPRFSEIIEAFYIFVKYKDDFLEAEHDTIYGPSLSDVTEMTDVEKNRLEELGWFINSDEEYWMHFV